MHPVTSPLATYGSRVLGKLCSPKSQPALSHLHQALHSPLLPSPLSQPEIRLLGLCQHGLHCLLGDLYLDREPHCLPSHCLFLGQDHTRWLLQQPGHQWHHQRLPLPLRRHLHSRPSNPHGLGPPDQSTPQTRPARHLSPRDSVSRQSLPPLSLPHPQTAQP